MCVCVYIMYFHLTVITEFWFSARLQDLVTNWIWEVAVHQLNRRLYGIVFCEFELVEHEREKVLHHRSFLNHCFLDPLISRELWGNSYRRLNLTQICTIYHWREFIPFSTTQSKNGLRVGMWCAGSALHSQESTGGKGPEFNCRMGWCSVAFQIIAGSNQKHGRQVTSCILMDLAADGTHWRRGGWQWRWMGDVMQECGEIVYTIYNSDSAYNSHDDCPCNCTTWGRVCWKWLSVYCGGLTWRRPQTSQSSPMMPLVGNICIHIYAYP